MSHPIDDAVRALIASTDPEAASILDRERVRQEHTIELIASENHASPAVMHAAGTCFTNKYAEGYARERAKTLFNCEYANVQPHSGAQANMAVFMALMEHGDTFASLLLQDGGHLSHGMKLNFSGEYFNPVHYPLHYREDHPQHEQIDYDAVEKLCMEHKPKMLLCGYSAYSRVIDFARFRAIADKCGAILMADIAHIAGLVAAGEHPSPFPHCHVVSTTTHKTLRGPRGGVLMTNDEEMAKKLDKAVFPGTQGGPLMHCVAGKAVAFGEALQPSFEAYQQRVVKNANALATALTDLGYRICSGGTDNHVMLVDLTARNPELTGRDAETWLEEAGIICNKNGIPNDERKPMVTSGIRLGSPATTTRGFSEGEMTQIASFIDRVLDAGLKGDDARLKETEAVRADVKALCEKFPMPGAQPAGV